MNWMELIAELVKSLAWPLSVFFIVYMLRDGLINIFPRLSKFKHKDTEIEFSDAINEIQKIVDVQKIETTPELNAELVRLKKVASVVPRSAIVQSWSLVDTEISSILIGELALDEHVKANEVLEFLSDNGVTYKVLDWIEHLRKVRNSAFESGPLKLSQREIKSYIELSIDTVDELRRVSQKDSD